ncbi:zinc-binding dehydrogenase, partial [Candidatus Bipolaricaulota bacterium]|nr:zinc-binding dehydrogenase [Candidatus Bipolaricaulota bacterium]
MKHQRIVVSKVGGPEVLEFVEAYCPEPQAGEVRIRVQAAGVSAYDLMIRSSRLMPPRPPYTPGVDMVGTIEKLGEGVDIFKPGQTVAALLEMEGGGYTEALCLPASDCVPVPAGLDPAQAVCLVANYLTAHNVLHRAAKIQRGERVLVHGAAGGVGSALLELGRLLELEMYGTASKHNHEFVSSLGATPIDYKNEDFVKRIRKLTGDGVDVVFDPIGGARQLWRSHRALRKGGRLSWFGMAAAKKKGIRVIPFTMTMIGILKLLPNGKAAPLVPETGKDDEYRAT